MALVHKARYNRSSRYGCALISDFRPLLPRCRLLSRKREVIDSAVLHVDWMCRDLMDYNVF